jgi:hypothetical protein
MFPVRSSSARTLRSLLAAKWVAAPPYRAQSTVSKSVPADPETEREAHQIDKLISLSREQFFVLLKTHNSKLRTNSDQDHGSRPSDPGPRFRASSLDFVLDTGTLHTANYVYITQLIQLSRADKVSSTEKTPPPPTSRLPKEARMQDSYVEVNTALI